MHGAVACLAGGMTFLQTAQHRSRSIKGLGNVIGAAAQDAGIADRTAHDLRKSQLTMIAESGGSAHAIMAWGGHRTLSEAQRYTAGAEMRRLVSGAEQEQSAANSRGLPVNS